MWEDMEIETLKRGKFTKKLTTYFEETASITPQWLTLTKGSASRNTQRDALFLADNVEREATLKSVVFNPMNFDLVKITAFNLSSNGSIMHHLLQLTDGVTSIGLDSLNFSETDIVNGTSVSPVWYPYCNYFYYATKSHMSLLILPKEGQIYILASGKVIFSKALINKDALNTDMYFKIGILDTGHVDPATPQMEIGGIEIEFQS